MGLQRQQSEVVLSQLRCSFNQSIAEKSCINKPVAIVVGLEGGSIRLEDPTFLKIAHSIATHFLYHSALIYCHLLYYLC